MTQKVEVHLEDYLAEHTVTFGLDGKEYEIGLSATNAEKLREALRLFTDAVRKATRGGGAQGTGNRIAKGDPDTAKIGAWAKENGHEISDQGRIHQSVREAYYAATRQS